MEEMQPGSSWATINQPAQVTSLATDPSGVGIDVTDTSGDESWFNGTNFTQLAGPHLVIGTTPATITAGQGLSITVTALDALGEQASDYGGTVHFSSTDPAAAPPDDYTFTATDAGSQTFDVPFDTAGTQTLTVTDGMTSAQVSVVVLPGLAASLQVTGPTTAPSGTTATFTVNALDGEGNLATGYSQSVSLSSSDTTAVLPSGLTLSDGTAMFTATLYASGTQTIEAADGANVLPGTANVIVAGTALVNGNLVVAGTSGNDTIAIDAFGAGLVDVTLNGTDLGFFTLANGGTVNVNAGAGDDVIAAQGTPVPITLDGGTGNNTLDLSGMTVPTTWAITGANSVPWGVLPLRRSKTLSAALTTIPSSSARMEVSPGRLTAATTTTRWTIPATAAQRR